MESLSDRELIQEFAASRSEAAFRTLVDRHVDHVHSVARRVTHNDDLARDVSQQVFVKLATRHQKIPQKLSLSVWLHVNTRSLAIDLVRSEEARRRREQVSQQLAAMNESESTDWSRLEPVIDEMIESLPTLDREIVIMRFYQKRSHGDIGKMLDLAPDAARMRVNRALERLRKHLSKRGVATTAAALAVALPAHAVTPAPAALASTISTSAMTATTAVATGGSTATLITVAKTHLAAIATVAVATPIISLQHATHVELRNENAALHQEIASAAEESTRPPTVGGTVSSSPSLRPGDLKDIFAQSDPMKRIRALIQYVDELRPHWIGEALEDLRQGSPEWDREAEFIAHMMLTRWGNDDPEAALSNLGEVDLGQGSIDARSILASLAASDLDRALAWLNDPDNTLAQLPKNGHYLAGTIAKEWVRQDPEAALAWAQSLPLDQRTGAFYGVLGSLATTDPERASTLAAELESTHDRTEIMGEIAHYWARQSAARALEWARSLEGGEGQNAMTGALRGWAQTEPQAAAEFIDQLPESERSGRHVAAVTNTWARQDPARAALWLDEQRESPGKVEAMGHLIWNWTTVDPEAASTWLANQPQTESRDRGIAGLATATFESDPARALSWASTISNAPMRQQIVQRHLANWEERDRPTARAWARENGFSITGKREAY